MPQTDQITEIASYVRNYFWVTIKYYENDIVNECNEGCSNFDKFIMT